MMYFWSELFTVIISWQNDLTEGAPRRVSTLIRQSSVKALLAPAPLTRGRSRSNFDTNNINEAINGSSENPGSLTTESSQRVSLPIGFCDFC